jgi:hypothetical protein
MSAKYVSTIVIGMYLILIGSAGLQEFQWKGTIEQEGGIKVIKNPEESLYGEITFELEEDLTIGREEHDKETMIEFVKRYKIKNWEQIKEGV